MLVIGVECGSFFVLVWECGGERERETERVVFVRPRSSLARPLSPPPHPGRRRARSPPAFPTKQRWHAPDESRVSWCGRITQQRRHEECCWDDAGDGRATLSDERSMGSQSEGAGQAGTATTDGRVVWQTYQKHKPMSTDFPEDILDRVGKARGRDGRGKGGRTIKRAFDVVFSRRHFLAARSQKEKSPFHPRLGNQNEEDLRRAYVGDCTGSRARKMGRGAACEGGGWQISRF
jgi:hypothetical protein